MDVSKQSAYTDYDWAIRLNRISLTVLGVWPEHYKTKQQRLLSNVQAIVMINIIIWACLIPTVHALLKTWGSDIMSMIDNLQYSLPVLIAIVKFTILWRKQSEILPLLKTMKKDWLQLKTMEERDIMIKRAQTARTFTILGCIIMIVSLSLAVGLPALGISIRYLTNITDPGKLMPLQTYCGFYDQDKSPFYEITFFMQSVAIIIVAVVYSSADSFLGVLVFHVCGQLENLKTRILDNKRYRDFESFLSQSVEDHVNLIRFIGAIDNIFNVMLLLALLYFGMLFAFHGFLFGAMIHQDHSVLRLGVVAVMFVNSFGHTCLYCVVGEVLVAQYEGVYKALCKYKWYDMEARRAKNLIIIMIRAKKPQYLTARKLFPMTISTLCNLIKTSAGYISVLLTYGE